MLNDVISDVRTHILRHFPERQIYLRSGGEVKYYMINLLVGHNPLRTSGQAMKSQKANYERMVADLKAKEENTRLMLSEQRDNFETMARQLEQKHQTLSQIMGAQMNAGALTGSPTVEYATSRVLMAPTARDATPRESRRGFVQTASLTTGEYNGRIARCVPDFSGTGHSG